MSFPLKRLLALLAVGLALGLSSPSGLARAEDDEPDQAEVQKLEVPYKKAMEALQAKDHEAALPAFEEFFKALGAAKLKDDFKSRIESGAQYNYACCLSLKGKKPEAIKALTRACELGFWDWDHIAKDEDLDPIRKEEGYAKAIEAGKAAQKAGEAKEADAAVAEAKKSLTEKPLFDYDFDVKTIDGKQLKLSDLKGKVVIVDVWGTWCPPCRKEIPHFVKLYDAYKAKGLEIVGLACERVKTEEQAIALVKKFAEEQKIAYPLAPISQKHPAFEKIPDFTGYPTTLWIDRDGKVRIRKVGYHDYGPLEGLTKGLLEAAPAK